MKIGIMGTHGSGKTKMAEWLSEHYGTQAMLLGEGARHCPYPINKKMSLKSQKWILARQISMEHQADDVPVVVCDRTVLDPIVYAIWMMEATNSREFVRFLSAATPFVLDWFNSYDLVIWCRPQRWAPEQDGVRDTDPVFQRWIDAIFERMIEGYDLPYLPPHWIKPETLPVI